MQGEYWARKLSTPRVVSDDNECDLPILSCVGESGRKQKPR
jgi:hypothetical protein